MKRYTLGYIFSSDLKKVLLVYKLAPKWQKGKINGIGGKNKDNENDLTCIVREIQEETSLKTASKDWIYLGKMHGENWTMALFTLIYKGELTDAKKSAKEEIAWFPVKKLPKNVIPNLHWQIPLAIEKLKFNALKSFDMEYDETIG